jgi:hypothetical protein
MVAVHDGMAVSAAVTLELYEKNSRPIEVSPDKYWNTHRMSIIP